MASPSTLVFAYRASRKSWGSTTMRAQQLASLVAPHLPGTDVQVKVFSRHEILQAIWARLVPQGATIFATKGVVRVLSPETVRLLHRRGCRVCLDVVDMRRDELPGPELGADCFVSPSLSGVARLQAHVGSAWAPGAVRPLVLPVLHNADLRLYDRHIRPQTEARIAYWGARKNAVVSPAIEAEVTFLEAADAKGFSDTMDRVLDYNVHYAVRPTDPEDQRIKPFTKGVNAAVLGALVFADRAVPDAVEFLGADYPFLIPGNGEADVLEGIARLRDSHGGPDWDLARARCRDMAERVSPRSLARQIAHIIHETQG